MWDPPTHTHKKPANGKHLSNITKGTHCITSILVAHRHNVLKQLRSHTRTYAGMGLSPFRGNDVRPVNVGPRQGVWMETWCCQGSWLDVFMRWWFLRWFFFVVLSCSRNIRMPAYVKQRFRRGKRPSKVVTCVQETPPRNVFKKRVLTINVHKENNNKICFQEVCRRNHRKHVQGQYLANPGKMCCKKIPNKTRKPVQELVQEPFQGRLQETC